MIDTERKKGRPRAPQGPEKPRTNQVRSGRLAKAVHRATPCPTVPCITLMPSNFIVCIQSHTSAYNRVSMSRNSSPAPLNQGTIHTECYSVPCVERRSPLA